jgi:hypothetical protein
LLNECAPPSCLFSLLPKSGSLAFLETHTAALTYRDAKQHEQLSSLAADRDDAENSSADTDGSASAAQTREQANGAAAPDSHDGSGGISSQQVQLAAVWSSVADHQRLGHCSSAKVNAAFAGALPEPGCLFAAAEQRSAAGGSGRAPGAQGGPGGAGAAADARRHGVSRVSNFCTSLRTTNDFHQQNAVLPMSSAVIMPVSCVHHGCLCDCSGRPTCWTSRARWRACANGCCASPPPAGRCATPVPSRCGSWAASSAPPRCVWVLLQEQHPPLQPSHVNRSCSATLELIS